MYRIGYYFAKLMTKLKHSQEPINNYYRKAGVRIGTDCLICSPSILTREPFLIEIGNNVTISTNVTFVTHDNSAKLVFAPEGGNLFGKIKIGNDCFIGSNSVLMYGVELGNHIIVAAGAVVTKSFREERVIIGGNPAKVISTWDRYYDKSYGRNIHRKDLPERISKDTSFLITR